MRPLWSRVFTIVLALPAAFAVPGVSIAHGVDHAEAQHHAAEHALESRSSSAASDHHEIRAEIHAEGHGDDHQHPLLRAGVSGKADGIGFLLTTDRFELPLVSPESAPRAPFTRPRVKAHGSHAPPPNLRGPPGVIG